MKQNGGRGNHTLLSHTLAKLLEFEQCWNYWKSWQMCFIVLTKLNWISRWYNLVSTTKSYSIWRDFEQSYVTKTVLVGPKWFWSDQIDLDLTLMIWSRPKWNGQDQNELIISKLWFSTKMNHNLDLTNSFWQGIMPTLVHTKPLHKFIFPKSYSVKGKEYFRLFNCLDHSYN